MLPLLHPEEFGAVFQAIHGHPPFPWQARLTARLAAGQGWPMALDLPTSAGKTAAIDAALFHLALDADKEAERRTPVRIAFVVDRRLVVDAAAERARAIARALATAEGDGPLARMAARLRHLAGDGAPPLVVATLRGGLPRENDWARSPGQPTILCSTVDQVGSRLLFRGYGVSDSMKPVHAGLLGSDCLFLLDEAHLSTPFVQTLAWVARYRRPEWCEREPGGWGVVTLSATPRGPAPDFALTADDRANAVLARRLGARKPAILRLLPLKTREAEHRNPLAPHAEAFAKAARTMLTAGLVQRMAVVVNRVALARTIFVMLSESLDGAADIVLLTGRIRDHDRTALLARYEGRLLSGAAARPGEKPLIVVATQTIEAGADFDFDALVTQIAPLDALRQRFGRLNRMGRDIAVQAMILAARDEITTKVDDPVYGDRAMKTWAWLQRIATPPAAKGQEPMVDFGIDALAPLLAKVDLEPLCTEQRQAPILRPADVLLLSWTAPVPSVDPDVAPFLHGLNAGAADVQIVWRADVTREDCERNAPHLPELISLAPPHAGETLAVPLWAARGWLTQEGMGAADTTDWEGAPDTPRRSETGQPVFRWAGMESPRTGVIQPPEIRPGDVLIAPSSYGGCDVYGWEPASLSAVPDVGDMLPERTGRLRRRLHPALFETTIWSTLEAALADDDRGMAERISAVRTALGHPTGREWRLVHPGHDGGRGRGSEPASYGGKVLTGRPLADTGMFEATTEDDEGLAGAGASQELAAHTQDVMRHAGRFAVIAGLSAARASDIMLAAELHDIGKADPRFQLMLHGGDRLAAMIARVPLAKSVERGRADIRAAWHAAGLPARWRHEARSVAAAMHDPRLAQAADPELVLWLIGTHHGQGRPLFPHHDPREPADQPGPQRLDFMFSGHDWPQLFARLKDRYGPWELARLEAALRLADHRASAEAAS